jgi:hypothetical protein
MNGAELLVSAMEKEGVQCIGVMAMTRGTPRPHRGQLERARALMEL